MDKIGITYEILKENFHYGHITICITYEILKENFHYGHTSRLFPIWSYEKMHKEKYTLIFTRKSMIFENYLIL